MLKQILNVCFFWRIFIGHFNSNAVIMEAIREYDRNENGKWKWPLWNRKTSLHCIGILIKGISGSVYTTTLHYEYGDFSVCFHRRDAAFT